MQDLINNFGIQPLLLVAQIVNFLIILYLLNRFAFKPILKLLQNRRATIEESQKNAEETKKHLEQTEEREKEALKKAQAQSQTIITDAKKQAAELQTAAEVRTKERIERMLEEAQQKINEQTSAAEKQLAAKVTTLSVNILEKSLKGFFNDKEQKEVVEKAVKHIKA